MITLLKKYSRTLLIVSFIISLSSCEKEIDVDLKSVPPQISIEGIVKEGELATVRVSHTLDFDNNDGYPNLSGAIVTISDDHGNSEILEQDGSGWYTATTIKGIVGYEYTMSVVYDQQEYVAISQMPPHVSIEAVTIKKVPAIDNPFVVIHFLDPVGEANLYYRALLFINGGQIIDLPEYVMKTDLIEGGKPYGWGLLVFSNDEDIDLIEKGDQITIEFQCLDKGAFKFFDSLANPVGTPTNPVSNISNGALGYFSACTADWKTIIADWED